MRYFFESGVWNNGASELFSTILRDLFRNLMASVAQNVRENPQRAAWNNNNNTEFEAGRQNMMGCPCISVYMNAVYEYTPRVLSRKIFRCRSLTTKPASQKRNKLTRSVFAYKKDKKQFKPTLFMLHVSRQTYLTVTNLFMWSDKWLY